jgi:hypothetical protein
MNRLSPERQDLTDLRGCAMGCPCFHQLPTLVEQVAASALFSITQARAASQTSLVKFVHSAAQSGGSSGSRAPSRHQPSYANRATAAAGEPAAWVMRMSIRETALAGWGGRIRTLGSRETAVEHGLTATEGRSARSFLHGFGGRALCFTTTE